MMKKIILLIIVSISFQQTEAQGLKGLLNKAKEAVTRKPSSLTNDDIISGLKEALVIGSQKGSSSLSQKDGFFANVALKIILPPEAQKVETAFRNFGLNRQVDEAILSINRAAEDACKSAAPIFSNAIKQIRFQDAFVILKGSDTAATAYLRGKTSNDLTAAFRPVIDQSLLKVGATKYWSTLMTNYNKFSLQKINPDLGAYVTERALSGIFYQVAIEEKIIRKDPLARTSEILKKVFAK